MPSSNGRCQGKEAMRMKGLHDAISYNSITYQREQVHVALSLSKLDSHHQTTLKKHTQTNKQAHRLPNKHREKITKGKNSKNQLTNTLPTQHAQEEITKGKKTSKKLTNSSRRTLGVGSAFLRV